MAEEELLKADSKGDNQEAELLILDEFAVLCRDLYAFYPMLIGYVDINRYDTDLAKGDFYLRRILIGVHWGVFMYTTDVDC